MKERIHNFSAGPAVLPLPVLETLAENLYNYQNSGIGLMEMSHRSKEFEEILHTTEKNLRDLLQINDDYSVLFTTGGATTQFSAVPMNLLENGKVADYLITGIWAEKAFEEAKKFGQVRVAATSADKNYSYIPQKFNFSTAPAYVHFTSNNTIVGTQWFTEPDVGDRVLVCDASSDLLHKKIDITKYGLIYAGAQKNLGPSGVTLVIIRRDLLCRTPQNLPILMDYNTYDKNDSLYNTPPTLPIYVVGEVLKWIKNQGGLTVIEAQNRKKAALLYDFFDTSDFYTGTASKDSRSIMNVTFRLNNKDLEPNFLKTAEAAGFSGLKGHKTVGGFRASIYNAFPLAGVEALVSFMKQFKDSNG